MPQAFHLLFLSGGADCRTLKLSMTGTAAYLVAAGVAQTRASERASALTCVTSVLALYAVLDHHQAIIMVSSQAANPSLPTGINLMGLSLTGSGKGTAVHVSD
jgi:hypothetical protein